MGLDHLKKNTDPNKLSFEFQALTLLRGPSELDEHAIIKNYLENFGQVTGKEYESGDCCFYFRTFEETTAAHLQELCDANEFCKRRRIVISCLN